MEPVHLFIRERCDLPAWQRLKEPLQDILYSIELVAFGEMLGQLAQSLGDEDIRGG